LGVINMKGRIFDPINGRFNSPDPLVQAPQFSQSYNRYMYVMGNPAGATDPTGYEGARQPDMWTDEYGRDSGERALMQEKNRMRSTQLREYEESREQYQQQMASEREANGFIDKAAPNAANQEAQRSAASAKAPSSASTNQSRDNNGGEGSNRTQGGLQKESVSIKSQGGGTLTINVFGDGSVGIKDPAAKTKERLLAAGVGRGGGKEDITFNVVVAADRDSALAVAKDAGLGPKSLTMIGASLAWDDSSPKTVGEGRAPLGTAVINSVRAMAESGSGTGYGVGVELTHEIGHLLMPAASASQEHATLGVMRTMPQAMDNPIYTPGAIDLMRRGRAGGFFK